MRSALTVAATLAVLGLTTSAVMAQSRTIPQQVSSIEDQLQADESAIQQDKAQMDRDQQTGNRAAFLQDKHRLYEDSEQQEYDRGTSEDPYNDSKRGW